jgi:transposase
MTRPYSVDLRERVVRSVEGGASRRATAAKFEVSVSFVIKLMQRWRRRGSVVPDRYGGWKRSPLETHAARIVAMLVEAPDLTIEELRGRLTASGIQTSRSALGRFLQGQDLTRKKDPARRRTETAGRRRGAGRLARAASRAEAGAPGLHQRDLGHHQRRGQRLVAAVPHGHWKTTTLVAALRHDRITAPCVFDGAINGERFLAWVEQDLAPTLRRGDLVIMDNLPAHKVQGVREAVQARHAHLLYLPPYSPDLNPIEQVFAKLKTLLRTAAKRTVDALWHAIGQALDTFSPSECNHYLAHAGYVPPNRESL